MNVHGGNVEQIARLKGLKREELIDFSANINPLGIPQTLKQVIGQLLEQSSDYPDVDYMKPRQAIAKQEDCDIENVLLSNGAAQLFFELAQQLKPQKMVILAPTFAEYKQAFSRRETECIELPLDSKQHYVWHVEELLSLVSQLSKGDVVLLCNPNNPTGTLADNTILRTVAEEAELRQLTLIIDEAFMDFVKNKEKYTFVPFLKEYPNTIVVKSMTKFFAVPGLRLGYAISANTALFKCITETRVPWSVNTLAAQSVSILLNDTSYHEQTMEWLSAEQTWLYDQLKQIPHLNVEKPTVNYIFFECLLEKDLYHELLDQRIIIRRCANYTGLNNRHYRVAIKARKDNECLIKALKKIMEA